MTTGNWSDKLAVAASAVSSNPFDATVIKATRHDFLPPKEKHVRWLTLATQKPGTSIPDVIDACVMRMRSDEWNVVLKTLLLVHRLMRDGDGRVMEQLRYRTTAFGGGDGSAAFPLAHFSDIQTRAGQQNSAFVVKYAAYLEEKVTTFRKCGVDFDKDVHHLQSADVPDMLEKLPKLQSLVNALLNCRLAKQDMNNNLVRITFMYLIKDSYKLYQALNEAVINMLEHYFTMNKEDATQALDIYKTFAKETKALMNMYTKCSSFIDDLPELSGAPTTLIEALEEYLEELKGTEKKGGKKKAAAAAGGDDADGDGAKSKKKAKDKIAKAKKKAKEKAAEPEKDLFDIDWDNAFGAGGDDSSASAAAAVGGTAGSGGGFMFASNPFDSAPNTAQSSPLPTSSAPVFDPFGDMSSTSGSTTSAAGAQRKLTTDDKLAAIFAVTSMTSNPTDDTPKETNLLGLPSNGNASAQQAYNPFGDALLKPEPAASTAPNPFASSDPFGAPSTAATSPQTNSNSFNSNPFAF